MTGETDRHISGNKITTRNKPMNSYYMLKWTGKIYQTQEEVDNSPHVKGAGPGDLVFEDISGPEGKPDGRDLMPMTVRYWERNIRHGHLAQIYHLGIKV